VKHRPDPRTDWTAIHYPNAFVDDDTGQMVRRRRGAEIGYVAFRPHPKKGRSMWPTDRAAGQLAQPHTAAGRVVRRVAPQAVFVTSGFEISRAESQHRAHAIIEQVIADAAASALTQPPSGSFPTNAAWAPPWAIAHNLTRAGGALAGRSMPVPPATIWRYRSWVGRVRRGTSRS